MQNCQIFSRIYCQDFSVLFFIGNEFRPIFFAIFGLDSVSSKIQVRPIVRTVNLRRIVNGVSANVFRLGDGGQTEAETFN